MRLQEVTLRKGCLPLIRPYVLSYCTFNEFEPIIVEVRDRNGRGGWGEGHISPGSSGETATAAGRSARGILTPWSASYRRCEGGCCRRYERQQGRAATALLTAIEMLEGHPLLNVAEAVRLPLLTPFNNSTPNDIEMEVERRLEEGFRTVKIKVDKDARAELCECRQSNAQSMAAQRCVSTPIVPS
jgi:L-alanine-DL-glutamate epimerase-like enolase superfamily enzyme